MRKNVPKVGDMALLTALCLLLTVVGLFADGRSRRQRQLARRALAGERRTLEDINANLDLEQRLRDEREL